MPVSGGLGAEAAVNSHMQNLDRKSTYALYKNPQNGYCEAVPMFAWLWMLLFGIFYMVLRGLWGHAVIMLVIIAFAAQIPLLGLPALLCAWIVYVCIADKILCTNYLRRGWVEVDMDQLSIR